MRKGLFGNVSTLALGAAMLVWPVGSAVLAQGGGAGADVKGGTQDRRSGMQAEERGQAEQRAGQTNERAGQGERMGKDRDAATKADDDRRGPDKEATGNQDTHRDKAAEGKGKDQDKAKTRDDRATDSQKASPEESSRRDASEKRSDKSEKRDERAGESRGADQGLERRDDQRGGERKKEAVDSKDRATDQAVRQTVTQTERDRAREAFAKSDIKRARDVGVRVDLGADLPRNVTLYALPPDIVAIVPAYRDYRYVALEDEIVIVDPATYVVVDVIPLGGRASIGAGSGEEGRGRLVLTRDEEHFIREHVDRHRKAEVRRRLAVGVDIPGSVELFAFPEPVISEVPKVRDFRYIVTDDGIAIVDPSAKDVVYLIGG